MTTDLEASTTIRLDQILLRDDLAQPRIVGDEFLDELVHAVLGAALVVAGIVGRRAAQFVNGAGGAIFLGLGLTGLFISGTEANLLAINGAGNVLHLGTSVLLLAVGLGAERGSRPSAP